MDFAFVVYVEDKRNGKRSSAGRFWTRAEAEAGKERALKGELASLMEEGLDSAEVRGNGMGGLDIVSNGDTVKTVFIDEKPCS